MTSKSVCLALSSPRASDHTCSMLPASDITAYTYGWQSHVSTRREQNSSPPPWICLSWAPQSYALIILDSSFPPVTAHMESARVPLFSPSKQFLNSWPVFLIPVITAAVLAWTFEILLPLQLRDLYTKKIWLHCSSSSFTWNHLKMPPLSKSPFIGKDPDSGKDWGQEEKGMTEDEMIGWHRWLNGHEFEQTPGDGEGQRSLVCCGPWGRKDSVTAQQLNSKPWMKPTRLSVAWSLPPSSASFLATPHLKIYSPIILNASTVPPHLACCFPSGCLNWVTACSPATSSFLLDKLPLRYSSPVTSPLESCPPQSSATAHQGG